MFFLKKSKKDKEVLVDEHNKNQKEGKEVKEERKRAVLFLVRESRLENLIKPFIKEFSLLDIMMRGFYVFTGKGGEVFIGCKTEDTLLLSYIEKRLDLYRNQLKISLLNFTKSTKRKEDEKEEDEKEEKKESEEKKVKDEGSSLRILLDAWGESVFKDEGWKICEENINRNINNKKKFKEEGIEEVQLVEEERKEVREAEKEGKQVEGEVKCCGEAGEAGLFVDTVLRMGNFLKERDVLICGTDYMLPWTLFFDIGTWLSGISGYKEGMGVWAVVYYTTQAGKNEVKVKVRLPEIEEEVIGRKRGRIGFLLSLIKREEKRKKRNRESKMFYRYHRIHSIGKDLPSYVGIFPSIMLVRSKSFWGNVILSPFVEKEKEFLKWGMDGIVIGGMSAGETVYVYPLCKQKGICPIRINWNVKDFREEGKRISEEIEKLKKVQRR